MSTVLPFVGTSPEDKRNAMERVLKSQTFSRSDQLKRFLQYICEKEIAGKADEINEYSIAVEALGRPSDYSPVGDSSVRTRAHSLRQKLQEYYELEEPGAELRIDVPKGAYNPHFINSTQVAQLLLARPASPSQPSVSTRSARSYFFLGAAAGALCMGLIWGGVLLFRLAHSATNRPDRAFREAWGQMLNPATPVDVYIATPPAMLLHSYKQGRLPQNSMNLLPAPEPVASWYSGLQMLDGGGNLYMHTTQDVFLFGDSLAATSAVQFLSAAGARPRIIPESNLRAFAVRGRNVILIGSPNYSPLAARFLMNTPFSVHFDPIKRQEVISDGAPDHGAKRIFRPTRDEVGMLTRAYGLITVIPSEPSGDGGPQTVILSGITSAGPQAALEFFRSASGLRALADKFRREGYTHFPPAYQVVVRCGLDHNLALKWAYETHQVIQGSPLLN